MANDCIPFYEAAYTQKLTVHFAGAVAGKRFSAPLEEPQSGPGLSDTAEGGNLTSDGYPAAGGEVGGVIMYDVAADAKGGVIRGAGTILPVMSGAAVDAGDTLQVDNAGRVVTLSTGVPVARALGTTDGADDEVKVELLALGLPAAA